MEVTLKLSGALEVWAKAQSDAAQAIIHILSEHQAGPTTPFDIAAALLKEKVKTLPEGFEFEIQQAIGYEDWQKLGRESRLGLGRHVRANQEAFGLVFLRKNSSNHAVYQRLV
ncbi:MAG: single-stranded DNA-binding protein [Pseudomonadaceae bacterium]|nr:single-stranded DNA-binding protein [Pseudomonadaceae bacterium]